MSMPDPTDPIPPTTAAPGSGTTSSTTGLPSNVAAALACIPLIGGIIFYVLEKNDKFVRFYAMQSIIFGAAWIVFSIVHAFLEIIFASIPGLRYILLLLLGIVWVLISIAFLIIWIIAMIKAFSGVRWDIPYIGPMARNQVDGTSTTTL